VAVNTVIPYGTSSAADPIPNSVLKQIVDVIAPFITELFNRSILAGHFPATFKEGIQYKLAVMAFKVLHGRAPSYLGPLVRGPAVSGRRTLRSADTNRILVPPVTSTTVGSQAFSVAAPRILNSLPDDVISAESLPTFQRQLKRHLFC